MSYELRQLTINSKLNWNPDVKFLMEVNLILIMVLADFSLIFFKVALNLKNKSMICFTIYFF